MNSDRVLLATITTNQTLLQHCLSSSSKRMLEIVTHYDTPKIVRFESKWIATVSLIVKLSLAVSCTYLMCQRSSYQVFDRSPISAVTIKVKSSSFCMKNSSIARLFPNYNCSQSLYDVNDFVIPPTENSAISISTRMIETEHILTYCNYTEAKKNQYEYSSMSLTSMHKCHERSRCILPPFYRYVYENDTMSEKPPLCWFRSSQLVIKKNFRAFDYILFIKNFVEFPQLGLIRDNFRLHKISQSYITKCEYDPKDHPLCPKFRILKIFEMVESDPSEYESMFYYGSLIEIKITWKCNLDKQLEYCEPQYEFQRLDIQPYRHNPYDPGSNFLTSRYFFRPNDHEIRRIHTKIYNLHIVVSVTGEVGRFDLFQTTTSIGSFLGIFGTGTIVCDFIASCFTNFKTVKYAN